MDDAGFVDTFQMTMTTIDDETIQTRTIFPY